MKAIINSFYSLNMNYKTFKQSIKVTHLNGKIEKFICKLEDINMKYRKKSVVVDALRYTKLSACNSVFKENLLGIKINKNSDTKQAFIVTSAGNMKINYGDWIIKGSDAKGGFQFWPVTSEYFAENYEKVER